MNRLDKYNTMNILMLFLFAALPFGQLGSFSVMPGVTLYLHDFVLLIMMLSFLFRGLKFREVPRLWLPVSIFVFTGIISLGFNTGRISAGHILESSLYLVRWSFYSLIYFEVIGLPIRPYWWLEGLFVSGCIFTALGFGQYLLYPDLRSLTVLGWDPHYYRLTSTFLDPNFAGLYISLIMILSLSVLRKYPTAAVMTFILMVFALYLTHSRSSYISFTGGLAIWSMVQKNRKVLFGILFLVLVIAIMPKGRLDVTNLFRQETTIARIRNWEKAVSFIAKSPVFGTGFNTLRYTGPFTGSSQSGIIPSKAGGGFDNSLLMVMATGGIVGFASYVWILVLMIRNGIEAFRNRYQTELGATFLSSITAIIIHSLFNNSLFYPWIMIWIWILAGATELQNKEDQGRSVISHI